MFYRPLSAEISGALEPILSRYHVIINDEIAFKISSHGMSRSKSPAHPSFRFVSTPPAHPNAAASICTH